MVKVPIALEAAVREATRAVVGDAPLATGALARAIVDRSQRYTSDRERLAQPRDADADLAARAAFFTIADAMKIALPLAELASRAAMPSRRPLRIVDLGAGCGAMTLGAIASLDPSIALEVIAIDRDARALDIAKRAIGTLAPHRAKLARPPTTVAAPVSITAKTGDATKAELPSADLVVIGTLLNELAPDAALAVVRRALAAISDDGAVIVIEPALRDTSRAVHAIRDAMIGSGAHVFAPCTRRCVPCTALVDPSDWCHEDRALELPPATAELARLTHLRDSGMKFSYLVLRTEPLDLVEAGPNAWRAVSTRFVEKGKSEIVGCSERGRVPLRLLKRHRNEATRDFERSERGDVLVITGEPDDKRLEISSEMTVERIDRLPRS